MGDSITSVLKKSSSAYHKILAIGVLLVFVFASIVMLSNVWYNSSYTFDSQTKLEVQNQEGLRVTNVTSRVTVTNYYPSRNSTILPKIYKFTHLPEGTINRKVIDNNNESLTKEKIAIQSFSWAIYYGNKEVRPEYKENKPFQFPTVQTTGMTNTTVVINWSYEVPEYHEGGDQPRVFLEFDIRENENALLSPAFLNFLTFDFSGSSSVANTASLFWYVVSYLCFVASGFAFSWVAFKDGKIVEAFNHLTKFDSEVKQGEKIEVNKDVEDNLKKIVDFPKEVGSFTKLVFGLSILILKIIVNNICKKHDEGIDSYSNIYPYKKKSLKKIFAKYSKQSFEKMWDFLPEFRTITIFIGSLAAVGIVFSFNIGAAASFVYTIVSFYFFLNVGSTFYFVQKSKIDRIWPLSILSAGIFVVNFPTIIELLRMV